MPWSRRSPMTRKRVSTSRGSSEEVGSSMMTTWASTETARARATICWVPTPRVCSGRRESTRTPKPPSSSRGLAVHPAEVDEAEPVRGLAAEEDVAGHAHQRDEVDLLVDRGDPGLLGLERAGEGTGSPAEPQFALVGPVHAGQDLDEGRLAGAVLADERVHLTGAQGEGDVVEGEDAGERLLTDELRGRRRPGAAVPVPAVLLRVVPCGLPAPGGPGIGRGPRAAVRASGRRGQYAPPSDALALVASYARSEMMTFSGISSPP